MDKIEWLYQLARDPRYSDTHRDLAARAIARAGSAGSIRAQISRDVAIEFARETLTDYAAGAPADADVCMWHAQMAGRLASDCQHLLDEVTARDPLEDLIDWTRSGMARLGLDQPDEPARIRLPAPTRRGDPATAAREATAPPYHGKRRLSFQFSVDDGPVQDAEVDLGLDIWPPDDPPRCWSCGHTTDMFCECQCCNDDHDGGPDDV